MHGPGGYFRSVDRLEAMHAEYKRMQAEQPPAKPDRFAPLKAARDAMLIEGGIALVLTLIGIAALTYNGTIVWP